MRCRFLSSCVGATGLIGSLRGLASSAGASISPIVSDPKGEAPGATSAPAGKTTSSHMEIPQHAHRRQPPPQGMSVRLCGLTGTAAFTLAMAPAGQKACSEL